ncbi:tastin isoform X3 [Meriones unguiculatus]|uniref:tastin isoform X3 n=1 Tax=Meriones unguiculatus TaxID=10047 RepID=UPI000B4FB0EF|nr:tastin isoform X1 [Meriones unguiculatus]XP_021490637.1 tastin isoform X3 [Meriones unguiculatus]XP_021490640.1 tastin isoform X3 [Meriones unguiculatus]
MTTLQTRKDPQLRGGATPTPSKIPVLSQRCPDFSSAKSSSLDQENQDPRKPPLGTQHPLTDTAGFRPKTFHQTEKSQRLGVTQPREPLEELKPSPGGSNVGLVTHPETEAIGAIEFVADPAALATILSGEGVKSCPLGFRSSLAQRVLVRGSKGGTTRRGQSARCSAYLAPRAPLHQLDPARASCFSRLEGPGPRDRTVCTQGFESLNPPAGPSFHPSTRPSLQELRRETSGGSSRTPASQASRLLPKTPVEPASVPLEGEHEAVSHSDDKGRGLRGLAQRVPLRQSLTQARNSYSSLKRFALRSKTQTQLTPLRSVPRVQQAQRLSGLSPQPSPEEPALPWEQIAVRLFDQESCIALQKGSGKPPVTSTSGPHPNRIPNQQELKMQRIGILQQLLRQEVEGLAVDTCAPPNGGSALDMTELQPLMAEVARTLSAPGHNSGTSLLGLSKPSCVTEPLLAEEHGEPKACPGEEAQVAQDRSSTESKPPGPVGRAGPQPPEPCLPALPGPLLPSCQGQSGPPEACPRVELGASAGCAVEARNPESSPQPCCSQGPPAATSLTFSSQSPLCASPPIRSLQALRSPTGHSGPSRLLPRSLALRQHLRACLTAIHCFRESRLDDECAFYTSRTPPPGPARVCSNPVATTLEWQDALCFIPVGSVLPQDSPS